jgi:hypothetical protein
MVKVCLNTPPTFHSLVAFSVKKVEFTGKFFTISPAQIFHHCHDLGGVLVALLVENCLNTPPLKRVALKWQI